MKTARLLTRAVLLLVAVAFMVSLFLPCQMVNVRGGWSIGLEAAPWFRTIRVFGIMPTGAVLALLLLAVSVAPFRKAYLALPALTLCLGMMAYYTYRFWWGGGWVWGRADEVLFGYHVHIWICYAALATGCIAACVDVMYYVIGWRKRASVTPDQSLPGE